MNGKQKVALWVGIVIITILGLVPPWNHLQPLPGGAYRASDIGYGPIWAPPAKSWGSEYGGQTTITLVANSVDLQRLGIEWFIALAITIGAIVTAKQQVTATKF